MEKCMMATSLAFLLCHPNSNTRCSNSCKAITPSSKKPNPNPRPKEQENYTSTISSPQLKKPGHKSKHLAEVESATRLKLVYDRLKSNHYPSIQALEGILLRGWEPRLRLVINEVLKVKHEQGVVDKFNKYREIIKQKVSNKNVVSNKRYYKKLMEDGFELLCFIGSKLACREKSSGLDSICCRKRYCGVCRLIGVIETSSFDCLRSVSVSESAWMAHQKAIRKEGDCRKAVIVCRVIAGRVMDHPQRRGMNGCRVKIGEDDNFDSVFVPISDSDTHDELLVFNPSAILPCFVVLYDVEDL